MTIGENIRKYRKLAKLTQKQLGELSGTSETTIKQYELGKRQPRIEQLEKVIGALNSILLLKNKMVYIGPEKQGQHNIFITDIYTEDKLGNDFHFSLISYKSSFDTKALLLEYCNQLNEDGRKEAIKRVKELTEIPRYTDPDEPTE